MLLCALGWREFAMHETENMLALSVALAEGAAAAFTQPFHLSPSDLCTHLPITITPRTKINAMLALNLDTLDVVANIVIPASKTTSSFVLVDYRWP
jgi:hypothetical protein